MRMAKMVLAAVVFSFSLADIAEAAATPDIIVIEVSGEVPGFTQAQLAAYLAQKMQEETALHFAAGEPGENPVPNRVVWSFKTLRKVWKGGSHSGFPSPTYLVSYLRAEVKLYLKGSYQMTMDTHPSVISGPDDKALSEMVHDAAHALFIENKTDMP
ncbi:MAG: hypothetical protein K2P57_04920 [Burkholderiales bacterium]|nr:hypothetical protein [Burkholderiales bacterium]